MDKKTWIGFLLIAVIIVGFSFINRPSKEELAERQRVQDSIAMVRAQEAEALRISEQISAQMQGQQNADGEISSEELAQQVVAVYGAFAPAYPWEDGIFPDMLCILQMRDHFPGHSRRGCRTSPPARGP